VLALLLDAIKLGREAPQRGEFLGEGGAQLPGLHLIARRGTSTF
jgi:hypothetical protein